MFDRIAWMGLVYGVASGCAAEVEREPRSDLAGDEGVPQSVETAATEGGGGFFVEPRDVARDPAEPAVDAALALQPAPAAGSGAACRPPLVFGHRGTPLHAPENTLPAYRWALDNGADGIEIDVRATSDGALVSMHDASVGRTTDHAIDAALSDLTLSEVQALDAGSWFDSEFTGTRVPTLDEIFAAFADEGALFLLDVKSAQLAETLVDAIAEHALEERAIFASHSLQTLAALHALAPDVPMMYFMHSMDEVGDPALGGLRYLRLPKDVEQDPAPGLHIAALGFEVAASGRALSWQTDSSALTSIVVANSARASSARRLERRPPECAR